MSVGDAQLRRFEAVAARVLGIGVLSSAALLAAGLAVWLTMGDAWATPLLDAGLVALMATPAARVVVSLVEYLRARDWFFVATTLGVLAVLLATLISAFVGP